MMVSLAYIADGRGVREIKHCVYVASGSEKFVKITSLDLNTRAENASTRCVRIFIDPCQLTYD